MKRKRIIVLSVLFMPILMVFAVYGLHRSGVCISQAKIFSDEEKMQLAASRSVETNKRKISVAMTDKGDFKTFDVVEPYVSGPDYIKENPDCCKIVKRAYRINEGAILTPNFFDQVWGLSWDLVKVNYRVRFRDGLSRLREVSKPEFHAVDVCGNATSTDMDFDDLRTELNPNSKFPFSYNYSESKEVKP